MGGSCSTIGGGRGTRIEIIGGKAREKETSTKTKT
jgi:hypothetical protein